MFTKPGQSLLVVPCRSNMSGREKFLFPMVGSLQSQTGWLKSQKIEQLVLSQRGDETSSQRIRLIPECEARKAAPRAVRFFASKSRNIR